MRTRIITVVAAGALSLSLATGCGNGDTTPGLTTNPPSTSTPATAPLPEQTTTPESIAPPSVPELPEPEEGATESGASFPGEDLSADEAEALQRAVDAGSQPWRLEPTLVAEAFVAGRFGWNDVDARAADPHTVEVTNRVDGSIVVLQLRQPVREGSDGIWVVLDGVRIS
ncbi:acyltransferase [Gordonia rhizosphera]|nr:acyltransferase [Gordonia rhizosphera]